MSRQTAPTRRHVLKGLGAAGLAFSARDALALFTPPPAAPLQAGEQPSKVGTSHPLVQAAVEAARGSELGRKAVALKLDVSEAYAAAREFTLTPEQARKTKRKSLPVEAVTLPITDQNSVKALRERLTTLRMAESVRGRSAFFYVHAVLEGGAGPRNQFDFVLGLAATDEELFASLIRVSPQSRGWVPGWLLVRRKRRPRGANRPSKSGAASADEEASVSSSPPDAGDEGVTGNEWVDCFLAFLSRSVDADVLNVNEICGTCAVALAALVLAPVTAPVTVTVAGTACSVCAPLVGIAFAAGVLLCTY